jgi:hypothetical protein
MEVIKQARVVACQVTHSISQKMPEFQVENRSSAEAEKFRLNERKTMVR